MNTVRVRNIIIGEGMPKICVPVVEKTKDDILKETAHISELQPDIVEFRADCFENVLDFDCLRDVLSEVRTVIGDTPLLLTLRTSEEGGALETEAGAYADILLRAVRSGLIDMADVEVFKGPEVYEPVIRTAHQEGVSVIASWHDFAGTPDRAEILGRLLKMQETGADIIKIAVMPHDVGDVMDLIGASAEMVKKHAKCPVIAISMGDPGMISRVICELYGSAVTFGAAAKTSAPGQIGTADLRDALRMVHSALHE